MEGLVTVGAFRCKLLSLLLVAAFAALGTEFGLGADVIALTVPSARAEPARSVPSGLSPLPDSSQAGDLPPPTAAPSSPTGNRPAIAEWLNQSVRLRDTVEAFDRPSSDGTAAGRIRAGTEVKAIGIVSGRQWVQIELPDRRLAYIPSGAVELNDNTAARSGAQGPEPAAATSSAATSPETTSTPATVRGTVTRVPNAATLVVADQRIRLLGIDQDP
jgi:hypothetical protein